MPAIDHHRNLIAVPKLFSRGRQSDEVRWCEHLVSSQRKFIATPDVAARHCRAGRRNRPAPAEVRNSIYESAPLRPRASLLAVALNVKGVRSVTNDMRLMRLN
jgi:hypothetical protein